MSEEEIKHGVLYYLNPLVWIRVVVSHILTFILILNHFFVLILGCFIAVLVVLFLYDRYALSTYDGSMASDYATSIFSKNEKYHSPLARGDKFLIQELSDYYASEKKQGRGEKKVQSNTAPQQAETTYHLDVEPTWDRRDDVSRSFISKEVRKRVFEIEQNVFKKQK